MADQKRKALPKFYSPRGIAKWPHLVTPDTQFKAEGEFHTKLVLKGDEPATQKLVDQLTAARDAAVVQIKAELKEKKKMAEIKSLKAADIPVKEVFDDDGNETGDIEVSFKLPATYKDKKTGQVKRRKLTLVDAKGHTIKDTSGLDVWGGSELKICFVMMPYYNAATKSAGITLRMRAVQIIKLVSGGEADHGFGEVEDGEFDASQLTSAAPEGSGGDEGVDGDDTEEF